MLRIVIITDRFVVKAWANFDCFEGCNRVFGASWSVAMADCASY